MHNIATIYRFNTPFRITSYNVCYTKLLRNLSDIEGEVALNQAVDKLVYDINNPISNEDLAFVEKLENILTTDDELAQAELINEFNNRNNFV